jgi:5-oxoprolinase (ATP-hydrolysing)
MWRFWIDRGGTFTDCIGFRAGELRVAKVLSSDRAPLEGIRRLLELPPAAPIPPCEVRLGTTVATNALLERRGTPTTLVITEGFEDLLEIGDQARPELFALTVRKAPPLTAAVVPTRARAAADGTVLAAADAPAVDTPSAAVVVLHGGRAPDLERALAAHLRATGVAHVSVSHEVDPEVGLLGRAQTTVADAYLTPLLDRHLAALAEALPGSALLVMQSSGSLTPAGAFRGRNAVLSGPAGGVVALGHVARIAEAPRVLGFDMGGTSTDVTRWDTEPERRYETRVGGVRLRAPALAIHTVAAGGGSLCRTDGRVLRVGPESAGASPGPLAYGDPAASEPTLTDVNVALGRLPGDRFPFALHPERARAALDAQAPDGDGLALAVGYLEVALEQMAEAIRRVTVSRGHDPRAYALVVFGGAGGQHALGVARRLGVRRVLLHPLGGVLSALGMGLAERGWDGEAPPEAGFEGLEAEAERRLPGARIRRRVDVRYAGTDHALTVDDDGDAIARFEAEHEARFGYRRPRHPVEITLRRVEARLVADPPPLPSPPAMPPPTPRGHRRVWMAGAWRDDVPLFHREDLGRGACLDGPALVLEATGALVLPPEARLTVGAEGLFDIEDLGAPPPMRAGTERDPVRLAIFAHAFMGVAERMGEVLRRTALSTNIRDRLDFSCAVFDRQGHLVANAPHIPVHLGAMGETVRAVVAAHPRPPPDTVFATNDPAAGGSHLPDITVVRAVHREGRLAFFVAARGHHADVGGTTPGSMPPDSTRLADEGVVLRHVPIVEGGALRRERVRALLAAGPHPARDPDQNVADLEAQIAATQAGAAGLAALCDRHGFDVVEAYLQHVQDHAAEAVGAALRGLGDGERTFEDALDDGTPVAVRVRIEDGTLDVDFAGTGPRHPGNLNAPRAVTVAAVLYALRCLVGEDIPLNHGCLRPVTLRVPEGSLLDPPADAAVAAGNVETSQRVVDVLLGALSLAAASQGTMNNITVGDATFGYYETLGGGAGATAEGPGASCVHTHMTNSRLTDVEVLESRYPLRVRRLARRRGSGGAGRHRGGDGLLRELEALAPLEVGLLGERRVRAPFGLEGGSPGARGEDVVVGVDGTARPVAGRARLLLRAGERLLLSTPGGGGYGSADA